MHVEQGATCYENPYTDRMCGLQKENGCLEFKCDRYEFHLPEMRITWLSPKGGFR
jgi:hypothetical protein